MSVSRQNKVFLILLLGYYAIIVLCMVSTKVSSSPFGIVLLPLIFLAYVFHNLGIPGVLQNNGVCGWGWCMPTIAGYLLGSILLVPLLWVASRFAKPRKPGGQAPGT